MNILHTVVSADVAGGQKVCLAMVKYLKDGGNKVVAVTPNDGPLVGILRKWDVEVEFINTSNTNKIVCIKNVFKFMRLIRLYQVQLIHTHDALTGTVLARVAGLLTFTPVLSHMHAIQDETFFSRNTIKKFIAKHVDNITSNISRQTLVASRALEQNLIEQGIHPGKIKMIPYGVDLDFDRELAQASNTPQEDRKDFHAFTEHKKVVGIITRLTRSKGLIEFIRVIPVVKRECPDAVFVVVGDDISSGGAFKRELEQLVVDLKVADAVKFMGYRYDIIELLQRFDILTNPSRSSDGSPLIILEAFFCGVPVIASGIAGVPEQVTHGVTGFLMNPGDEKMLADFILTLLKDENKRLRMARAAREEALQKHTQARMIRDVMVIYDEILKRKK